MLVHCLVYIILSFACVELRSSWHGLAICPINAVFIVCVLLHIYRC